MTPTVGSLFSGIGGLELAVGIPAAWHCETDPHASRVLGRHWPGTPNLGDITAVDWDDVQPVDILVGGFPCQDISSAGKRAGIEEGTRSGLWSYYAAAVRHLRPHHVLVENVDRLLVDGMGRVVGDLAEAGYDSRWVCVRASDVGAPHRRGRVFIHATPTADTGGGSVQRQRGPAILAGAGGEVEGEAREWERGGDAARGRREAPADTDRNGRKRLTKLDGEPPAGLDRPSEGHLDRRDSAPADTDRTGPQGPQPTERHDLPARSHRTDWGRYTAAIERWEPIIGRPAPNPVDDRGRLNVRLVEWMMGYPQGWVDGLTRTDALRCLGNAVVPQAAAHAWDLLTVEHPETAA